MSKKVKQIKQSKTIEIKRSQINLNPFNPKRHTDKKIQEQKRNLERLGLMGGIVWNEQTGNLIDGHRRIKALDLHFCYDGTEATDYNVKVEAVELDNKAEREQMTYMAIGDTKADYGLIAEYWADIDSEFAGFDEVELAKIEPYLPVDDEYFNNFDVDSLDDLITSTTEPPTLPPTPDENEPTADEKKAIIKTAKQAQKETAQQRFSDLTAYITISFENAEEKRLFCDIVGVADDAKFIQGKQLMELL